MKDLSILQKLQLNIQLILLEVNIRLQQAKQDNFTRAPVLLHEATSCGFVSHRSVRTTVLYKMTQNVFCLYNRQTARPSL